MINSTLKVEEVVCPVDDMKEMDVNRGDRVREREQRFRAVQGGARPT